MKIGEFAKRYSVSTDTVRYYIRNGLLIPDDHGTQSEFAQRECRDMETILSLKKKSFSLKEILKYLSIFRISTMVEPESIQEVVNLLNSKDAELEQQINSLKHIRRELRTEIDMISNQTTPCRKKTGVPLKALPLLACPCCGSTFELQNASLDSRYIYHGTLVCGCGYEIQIEDGIVETENRYLAPYDKPDLKRGLYRTVSDSFVTYLQKSSDFALRKLHQMDIRGKVVMEGHCNGYFFLYNNLNALDPEALYIITDKFPEMLEMYKQNIEQLDLGLDILYIADASTQYPLKHNCVDILMNFMGDNEHSLYFKSFYLSDIKPYLKAEAKVIGATLGYRSGAKSLKLLQQKYPEGNAWGYCRDQWNAQYACAGYRRSAELAGVILQSHKQYSFACHVDGEELFMEYFIASPEMQKPKA